MLSPAQPASRLRPHSQRALGAFYTRGNPFVYPAFQQWLGQVAPGACFLEPFAGDQQIPRLVAEAGAELEWSCFDIDPTVTGAILADTLANFPAGFDAVVTNPPYLSYHFAQRKGLAPDKEYFKGYSSLYQTAIAAALEACPAVAMIVPESFVTSGLFRERLQHVVSLPFRMFDDTEMPTCLALWGPVVSDDFALWRERHRLGTYRGLAETLTPTPCASRVRFNVLGGQIGLRAVDSTAGPSIAFCAPEMIPAEKVKHSARLVTRIEVRGLRDTDQVLAETNRLLTDWRERTEDVLLTAFKGTRTDGRFRRRLDFANARALLSHALCRVEGHSHS